MTVAETFMPASQVKKMVSALVQCAMMIHLERQIFDGKTTDEVGEWLRKQLNALGFPSFESGLEHIVLYEGLFEPAEIPAEVLDEMIGWKALAMDYKFMLDTIATKIDANTETLRALAMTGLTEESEDSRRKIDEARTRRRKR